MEGEALTWLKLNFFSSIIISPGWSYYLKLFLWPEI